MGRYYVWEAMTYLNRRSSLGRVVINPPQKLQPSKPCRQGDNFWFICKCGRGFKEEEAFDNHRKSHPEGFQKNWREAGGGGRGAGQGISDGWVTGTTSDGNMHKCEQCGKLLQTAVALRNHMFIHSGEKPWQCDKCPAVFRLYSTLYDHKKVSHVPGGKFKCSECPCRFTAQLGLKRHLGIYHPRMSPEMIVRSSSSGNSSGSSSKGRNPKNLKIASPPVAKRKLTSAVISEDGTRTYPCQYCGKVFYKSQYLRNHLPVHTGERRCVCTLCGVGFKSSSNLLAHKKVSHVEGGSHKCEKCPCVFATLLGLVRHRRLFHHGNAKTHLVTKKIKQAKGRTAVKLSAMSQHRNAGQKVDYEQEVESAGNSDQDEAGENSMGGADGNSFECSECGKVLSSLLCLRNHQMIHTGEKPWICDLCGAAFRLNSTLYGHKKTSHVPNGPYKCDECPCRFAAVFGLKRHKICFHEAMEGSPFAPVASTKLFKCVYCPKAYKNEKALKEHMLSHGVASSTSAAVCPKCNGTYSNIRALKKHLLTGHVPGGRKCPSCSCSFLTIIALKAHEAKVHHRAQRLLDQQPVMAAVKALKSRGVTVEPTHGSSDMPLDGSLPTCERCNKNFSSQASLKNHLRYCQMESIACDICDESFSIYSNMIRHKRTCHVPNGQFKCSHCTHCYSTTRGYMRHIAQAHGQFKRSRGPEAKSTLGKPGLAIQRIIENSKMRTIQQQQQRRPYHRVPESLRKYKCNLCGNAFTTTGNYKKHMITSHVPDGQFPCSSCSCVFNTYNALNSHVGNRHAVKSESESSPSAQPTRKKIMMTEAPKSISYKRASSASPQKTSTPVLSKIKFNFVRPNTSLPALPKISPAPPVRQRRPPTELMKRMARLVGGPSPPKEIPNLIPVCTVIKQENVEAREEKLAAEVAALLSNDNSNPRCDICGKTYKSIHSLKGHMSVHTGEKPFGCNQCGQRFRQKGDVISHKKTNHSDGKFKCGLCPCRFITAQGLKRHKAQIHSIYEGGQGMRKKGLKKFRPQPLASIMKPVIKHERPEVVEPSPVQYNKVTLTFGSSTTPVEITKPVAKPVKAGNRAYDCDLCDASFNHQQNLMRHRKNSHVPFGEFKCSSCSCRFVSSTSLRTHEAIFHQRKSEKNLGLVKQRSNVVMSIQKQSSSIPAAINRAGDLKPTMTGFSRVSRVPKLVKDARGRSIYVCELCGATFSSHGNCTKHFKTSHVDGGQYACGRCTCIFSSIKTLTRHESSYHSGDRGGRRQGVSQFQSQQYEIEHHGADEEEYESMEYNNGGNEGQSDHQTTYGNQYDDEEEMAMGDGGENAAVDPLDTSFEQDEDSTADAPMHFLTPKVEITAVSEDERDPLAEEALNTNEGNTENSNDVEDKGSGASKPQGTIYGSVGALNKERANRFAVYAKKEGLTCGVCKMTFSHQSGLRGHMRIHTGDKPYQCRFCGICFRLSGTLATHIKKCHEQDNPYQCEFCSCTFASTGTLSQHILKFHPTLIKEDES